MSAVDDPGDSVGSAVFGERLDLIRRYADLLATRGVEWGLIGPREPERLWSRHLLNSVAAQSIIASDATVVDVGSGAGLPGIPVAIARPDLRVTLLEPLLRRSTFLSQVVEELGLSESVTVVRGRAEDWPKSDGQFDAVISRAVAPLPRLVEWSRGLRRRGGFMLALKGDRAHSELREARKQLSVWGLSGSVVEVRACEACEPTWVVRIGDTERAHTR